MLIAHYYTHKPGGFCSRLYRLLVAHATRSETVYLTLDSPPVSLPGVRVERIPFCLSSRSGWLFWMFYAAWAPIWLAWYCVRHQVKTVLCFGPLYSFLALPAKLLAKTTVVLFCRSDSPQENKLKGFRGLGLFLVLLAEKVGIRTATRTVFIHQAMRASYEMLLGQPIRNSFILPNNVTPSDDLRKKECRPTKIIMAGRLTRLKNFSWVVQEMRELERLHPQIATGIQLTLVGEGPEREALEEIAQSLMLIQMSFEPWSNSLSQLMKDYDILLHPSQSEGMSNVILDALAVGLPVLLSDIPAHRCLGYDSLLFSLKERGDLASKLLELFASEPRVERLREDSRALANDLSFDWEEEAVRIIQDKKDTL